MKTSAFILSVVLVWSSGFSDSSRDPADIARAVAGSVTLKAEEKATVPVDEKAKAEAEEAKKKKARIDKINKLKFDRTPQKVLETWAPRPESEEEKKKRVEKESEAKKTPPTPEQIETAQFDESLRSLQEMVSLGEWEKVKGFWKLLQKEEVEAAYQQILKSLQSSTPAMIPKLDPVLLQAMQRSQEQRARAPQNTFSFDDVFGLIQCAPPEWEWIEESIGYLGKILRSSITTGNVIDVFLERAQKEKVLDALESARLLHAAGYPTKMGVFLPELDDAVSANNHEALNLLSEYYYALYSEKSESVHLDQAWEVTQAVLASEDVKVKEREAALKQAVSLAGRLDDAVGEKWLEETFARKIERGKEVLRIIGTAPGYNMIRNPSSSSTRLKALKLQSTAVETLISLAPKRAEEWQDIITLLAGNWLKEGEVTSKYDASSSRYSGMQRDRYGNYYYMDRATPVVRTRIQPIKTGDLLEIKPSEQWIALVDESLRPKFDMLYAQLFLKVNEEDEAFPYVEKVAKAYPEQGEELVNQFLQVWTENHDPNASRNRSNYYSYYYGYERKAESIPLTRSKQERNLIELADVVKRLRALPIESLDEDRLANAFTTCHSSAEVYQLSAIESVFGSIDALKPETLAALAQRMRRNLSGVWRKPDQQKKSKTNRKQKDIEMEVRRGYAVGNRMLASALEKHPDSWQLLLARAAFANDENNYEKELNQNSDFSAKRQASFADFARAADCYVASPEAQDKDEETVEVFQQWFYAGLGATELSQIDDAMVSAQKEPARIRDSMNQLSGEVKERHFAKFAQSLFTRMSGVKPAVKHRYLEAGFEIVGDHKDAGEAKKVFDYYKDLITEIEFESQIDGSAEVGSEEPFGLFVNIRHTREIERESGGFSRYLQNQNNGQYYYNYGRPTENYREKFEEIVRESLGEQFEIKSVTFQTEDVNSRAVEPYGWRMTPYAYILLKAKGPEVDQIPSVRLDLDFLDTSGYAVLPIETAILPVNAEGKGEARPADDLVITQTLDERQAGEGKLILEVSASGTGLVPELDSILDISPPDFEVVKVEDEGVAVARFDPENPDNKIVSERNWLVTMQARDGLGKLPESFTFAEGKTELKDLTYQRYVDADLTVVESTISLENHYGKVSYAWVWLVLGVIAVAVGGWIVYTKTRPEAVSIEEYAYELPETVTPFTVIGLLKDIERNNGFSASAKEELGNSINRLERFYFSEAKGAEPDLTEIARKWIRQTRPVRESSEAET